MLGQISIAALHEDVDESLQVVQAAQLALALVRAPGQQQRLRLNPHDKQALEQFARLHLLVINRMMGHANALQSSTHTSRYSCEVAYATALRRQSQTIPILTHRKDLNGGCSRKGTAVRVWENADGTL